MHVESSSQPGMSQFLHPMVALTVACVSLTLAVTGAHASDDDDVVDSPRDSDIAEADADDEETIPAWIENEDILRHDLEMRWRRRIILIDRLCNLTGAQKQKLEFVSRGDIKRILDRMHAINARVQLAKVDPHEAHELAREAQQFQNSTSTVRSLTANCLAKLLNSEQFARYEPLRMVIHLGGRFQTEDPESVEVLEIDVHGTTFADDDTVDLRAFPHLQRLLLANTQIGDNGLEHVEELRNLVWLDAAGTRVSDAGLQHLQRLTHLHRLSLARTRVTNAGLAHLKGLTSLNSLDLDGTLVNDLGMSHLAGLTNLRQLYIRDTPVTEEGLDRLQQALPQLMIHVRARPVHKIDMRGGMGLF